MEGNNTVVEYTKAQLAQAGLPVPKVTISGRGLNEPVGLPGQNSPARPDASQAWRLQGEETLGVVTEAPQGIRGEEEFSSSRGCVEVASVEGLGSQVGTVGPDHGTELGVDRCQGEEGLLSKRLENGADRASELAFQVDDADAAVGEANLEPVVSKVADGADIVGGAHGKGSVLLKGSSAMARCRLDSSSERGKPAHSSTAITTP